MTTIQAANIGRCFFIGLSAFMVSMVLVIVYRYTKLPKRAKSRALIRHIASIGASYVFFVAVSALDSATRMGNEISFRLPMKIVGILLGIVGFYSMMLHLRFERNAMKHEDDLKARCDKCGSQVVDKFCAVCGTKQSIEG